MSSWLRRFFGSFSSSGGTTRTVEPGHRFAKISELMVEAEAAWVVSEIIAIPDLPPHARLYQEKAPYRTMTLAMPVLLNRAFYRRLPPVSSGERPFETRREDPSVAAFETNIPAGTKSERMRELDRRTQRVAPSPIPAIPPLPEAVPSADRSPTRPLAVPMDLSEHRRGA